MRPALAIAAITILAALLGGCILPAIAPTLTAQFTITSWTHEYYEFSGEWSGYVYVYFDVTNTGAVEIDYYKVYFDVQCADGSVYHDWTNGTGVGVGKTYSDWTIISTGGGKRVVGVTVSDYALTSY